MKKMLRRKINITIAVILSAIFVLMPTSAFASARNSVYPTIDLNLWVAEIESNTLDLNTFNNQDAFNEILDSMSPEALEIFYSFIVTEPELLDSYMTHNARVDSQVYTHMSRSSIQSFAPLSSSSVVLTILSNSLRTFLPTFKINPFLAVASSMLAFTLITTFVAYNSLVGSQNFMVGNWGTLSGTWWSVRSAFANAFSSVTSTVNINGGFDMANPRFQRAFTTAIENELDDIAGRFGNFLCEAAANAMIAFLRQHNQRGDHITLVFWDARGRLVYSLSNSNRIISTQGFHVGVSFNNVVRCNVHPTGRNFNSWHGDFVGDFNHPIPGIPENWIRRPTMEVIRQPFF